MNYKMLIPQSLPSGVRIAIWDYWKAFWAYQTAFKEFCEVRQIMWDFKHMPEQGDNRHRNSNNK